MLTSTIQQTYPPHEWEKFEGHFGGLIDLWVSDERVHSPESQAGTDDGA
jgi:hypothetical protein